MEFELQAIILKFNVNNRYLFLKRVDLSKFGFFHVHILKLSLENGN